jgi:hypothetical protein
VFVNTALKNHIETSPTIQTRATILAEWNMNVPDNIFKLGNYRNRDTTKASLSFDKDDVANLYTGATDADIVVDNGYDNDDVPSLFSKTKEQYNMFYSLEDCVKPFRPRSGINKAFYIPGRHFHNFNTNLIENQESATFAYDGNGALIYEYEKDSQGNFVYEKYANGVVKNDSNNLPIKKIKNIVVNNSINGVSSFTQRPRYYMPSRDDQFKYWTSYRTEKENEADSVTKERGISTRSANNQYPIEDVAPFVVYKENVPANRLIVKMQTHVGTKNLGPFKTSTASIADPLYGNSNKQVPINWRIEYLSGNSWIAAKTFNANSLRDNGLPVINEDGYVELSYGLIIPIQYKDRFIHAEKISSTTLLPTKSIDGYGYLLITSPTDKGVYYVWNNITKVYETFIPEYGWKLTNTDLTKETNFLTDFTSPEFFIKDNITTYREFQYVRGIRIVVESMNKFDSTFDLIEMSPRLIADISNKTINYKVTKQLSDLGSTSLPVGQLLASTGSISIFDDDQAFNENNTSSIVSKYVTKNIKFNFYETFLNISGNDYSVPIKTLYSEGFPQADITGGTISLELRDFYFYFESMLAPKLFLTNVSVSYAISILLDSIGFSNYVYKRIEGELDPVIPYFFVGPDQSVAEVLNSLAVSTQTAMFFDEYNNFIAMSKNYLMPTSTQRSIDTTLIGSKTNDVVVGIDLSSEDAGTYSNTIEEFFDGGLYSSTYWEDELGGNSPSLSENSMRIIKNQLIPGKKLPNIISIASQDKKIYNDGKINYTSRYIDKTYSSIGEETATSAENRFWVYKPSLLWEISNYEELKGSNQKSSGFTLSAIALNSTLVAQAPTVVNYQLTNNVIDFGESIYLISRNQGYFYANGEIIRYDAIQYFVDGIGNVWISSDSEYKNYLNKLKYNGKIYATGKVRIYSEPYYETVSGITRMKNGVVAQHGRAQFGTPIVSHKAAIDPYWTNVENRKGCLMSSKYLFGGTAFEGSTTTGTAGISNTISNSSFVNGVIKRFLSEYQLTETERSSIQSIDPAKNKGLVQSSALVFKGKDFIAEDPKPIDHISYVYKTLDNSVFKHFGTRMRVIGEIGGELKIENGSVISTSVPLSGMTYYQNNSSSPEQNVNISGNSGGLAVLLNPETNNGYYFEIIALDGATENISNVIFYKIEQGVGTSDAIPTLLFNTYNKQIQYDSGDFAGISRKYNEPFTTVYDLAVEYEDLANKNTRRFYLYVNDILVGQVDDTSPLPAYQSTALFVRGSSKCMFENIYALTNNYSQDSGFTVNNQVGKVFSPTPITANESLKKYALSGILQESYLSGLSSLTTPAYSIYFEEFGTIMRECSYINAKFDNAYPALYAKLVNAPDRVKEYTISGFEANAYGAEFLVFNATDMLLDVSTTTSNFLKIQGIAFTSDSSNELTVDDYFKKRSSFSDPELVGDTIVYSPNIEKEKYNNIKLSRMNYGKSDFSIEGQYIQTTEDAEHLMGWLIDKLMVPRKAIGLEIFANTTIQLGDIVSIDYKNNDNLDLVASSTSRFVIYHIEYSRGLDGPKMTVYLSEV